MGRTVDGRRNKQCKRDPIAIYPSSGCQRLMLSGAGGVACGAYINFCTLRKEIAFGRAKVERLRPCNKTKGTKGTRIEIQGTG